LTIKTATFLTHSKKQTISIFKNIRHRPKHRNRRPKLHNKKFKRRLKTVN